MVGAAKLIRLRLSPHPPFLQGKVKSFAEICYPGKTVADFGVAVKGGGYLLRLSMISCATFGGTSSY